MEGLRRLSRAGRERADEPAEALANDEDLVRSLYEQHGAALLGLALSETGGDRQWAEDVVQETLLRAWRNADKLDFSRASLRPWLFTVARRVVIDGRRSRSARPQEVEPTMLELIPAADEIDKSLSALMINEAIEALTPAHRDVVVELYFRGKNVSDAAQALGIPPGTVKSRVFYALRALRLALEERGVTDLA
jgi:RNA polymerase sigma-70 factor (ECF subfamily)